MKISAKKHELRLTELPLFVTMYMIKYYNESGTRLSFGPVCRSFPGKLRNPGFARKQLPGSRHSASAAATPRGQESIRSDR